MINKEMTLSTPSLKFYHPLQQRVRTYLAFKKAVYPNLYKDLSANKSVDYLRKNQLPGKKNITIHKHGFYIPKEINVSEFWSQKQYADVQKLAKLDQVKSYCDQQRKLQYLEKLRTIEEQLKEDPLSSLSMNRTYESRQRNFTQICEMSPIKESNSNTQKHFQLMQSASRQRINSQLQMKEFRKRIQTVIECCKKRGN